MKATLRSLSRKHYTLTKHRSLSTGAVREAQKSFLDTPYPSVYEYSTKNSEQEPHVLRDIRESTMRRDPANASKMVSPLQGAFMAHLVRIQKPRRILELGCFTGYSAVWLAHGLRSCHHQPGDSPQPHLWTCENERHIAAIAAENVIKSGFSDSVTVLDRTADHVLTHWDPAKKLDLVFIDANKSAYSRYYDLVLKRDLLSENGQLIIDNVLLNGNVHARFKSPKPSILTKLRNFNPYVSEDPETNSVILPVFDGLMFVTKKH
ncbi:hypothetical protein LPJ59_000644 [Coemansia sp. RSA 2399]|nr:hypothetical protein LPJ59_000644 [Coemansia sp. RSA 2399]KAJ1907799.1 hypothetical protein LPJ81_000529 [Coemansia sp. IMI 209127]